MYNIRAAVEKHQQFCVEARRTLHSMPELAFQEIKTAKWLEQQLQGLDVEIRTGVATTGIVACLETGRPGPVVLLRADMDALPITEETGLDCASLHEGCMHACGHDSHMAMVLTCAKVLTEMRGELSGSVRFIFQPAEEYPGGALPMVQEGVMDGVDYVLATHVWPSVPSGQVAVKSGPVMAAMDRFDITIIGKGGHAAKPHECVDALEVGTQVVGGLQRIVSRMVDPLHPALLTVGSFHSGNAFNVIPETADMSGTLRSFDAAVRDRWKERIEQVVGGICSAMGASYSLKFTSGYPYVDNDAGVADIVRRAAVAAVGEDNTLLATPSMGGEDVAYFLQKAPGCFFFLGTGFEEGYPIHNAKFTIAEDILPVGVEVLCRAAIALLGNTA